MKTKIWTQFPNLCGIVRVAFASKLLAVVYDRYSAIAYTGMNAFFIEQFGDKYDLYI